MFWQQFSMTTGFNPFVANANQELASVSGRKWDGVVVMSRDDGEVFGG